MGSVFPAFVLLDTETWKERTDKLVKKRKKEEKNNHRGRSAYKKAFNSPAHVEGSRHSMPCIDRVLPF